MFILNRLVPYANLAIAGFLKKVANNKIFLLI